MPDKRPPETPEPDERDTEPSPVDDEDRDTEPCPVPIHPAKRVTEEPHRDRPSDWWL